MDSMIKETNDNLKTIVDGLKSSLDTSTTTLENIQIQMDKKVEEAKKYKISVDSAKDRIRCLEEENKSLEISLKELSDTYGKLNLVSVIEAGNREIKTKINDNLREVAKQKEHIADLTNKARTIKDLLINMKKDKTIKSERLENLKVIYEYFSTRINDVIDYAFNHSNSLMEYKSIPFNSNIYEVSKENEDEVKSPDLENTMIFDEIANIDENKNFKDEMSFISSQIDNNIDINKSEKSEDNLDEDESDDDNTGTSKIIDDKNDFVDREQIEKDVDDSTNVFDSILDNKDDSVQESSSIKDDFKDISINEESIDLQNNSENILNEDEEISKIENDPIDVEKDDIAENDNSQEILKDKNNDVDDTRINKLNELFSTIEENKESRFSMPEAPSVSTNIEKKIDNAYLDIFGKPIEEENLNSVNNGLTDIFGNSIKEDTINKDDSSLKNIEDLFTENGIDFNKFKEDEQNYLKEIYDEEKFTNIINALNRNNINLDNLYYSFNIFGEISANELESIISKLLSIGQSVEAIGMILEKLPKVKKYNLNEAIESYGDYIKNIDITDLIIKAKELYKNGGNK